MAKAFFTSPFILLTSSWGGDGSETGGGSGGTSDFPTIVDYYEWVEMYGEDLTNDGTIDLDDYVQWWLAHDLGPEDWDILNPDLPNPYDNP